MKTLFSILCFAVCCASASFAQDKKPSAEEKAWMEYMKPGAMHSMLNQSNGIWTEEISMWMAPGAPEMKSSATAVNKMILGNRYQESMHRGTFNGMPFEGMSIMGYDNAKKVFQSSWIDNMGTGIMNMEGTYNEAKKTVEFHGTSVDPVTGNDVATREVFKIVDDNTQTMEMFMTPKGGNEYKSMHIDLKRKVMKTGAATQSGTPTNSSAPAGETKK
jgi:hypothetical protein